MSRTKTSGRPAAGHRPQGGAARTAAAGTDKAHKDKDQENAQADWEDAGEELDAIPDIDGMLDKPAANRGGESEARRRIEMLREDRLLRQALSDVFDL